MFCNDREVITKFASCYNTIRYQERASKCFSWRKRKTGVASTLSSTGFTWPWPKHALEESHLHDRILFLLSQLLTNYILLNPGKNFHSLNCCCQSSLNMTAWSMHALKPSRSDVKIFVNGWSFATGEFFSKWHNLVLINKCYNFRSSVCGICRNPLRRSNLVTHSACPILSMHWLLRRAGNVPVLSKGKGFT